MTMTDERTRSIRWGGELLEAMLADASIQPELKQKAELFMKTYPWPDIVSDWITNDFNYVPADQAEALVGAYELFLELRRQSDQGSKETRNHLMYVMRHFPDPSDVKHWASEYPDTSLREWVSFERS